MAIGIFIMLNDGDLSTKARGKMTDVAPQRTINDVSMLKALADPIRMLLLELTMAQPQKTWTARELAAQANVLPTNIYYHLNMLEKHELLQVRDTRVVNGIIEKHYGAGQRSLTFQRRSGDSGDGAREMVTSIMNRVRDDIDHGLASGSMSASPDAPVADRMMVSMATIQVPEDSLEEFRATLIEVVSRYAGKESEGKRFNIVIAFHPI